MNLFGFLNKRSSAPVARERLQILLAYERSLTGGNHDLATVLKEEILQVIARHFPIDRDKINVRLDRKRDVSTLEIDVEVPFSN